MRDFLNLYIITDIDIISKVIRIVIGILLLVRTEKITSSTKKNLITIYYGFVLGCIFSCLINPVIINILIGGIIGICLSLCMVILYKGDFISNFILFFIIIYEVFETVFYAFEIHFCDIFRIYEDMYLDYTTIYVKLLCSVLGAYFICIFYKKRKDVRGFHIADNVKYDFIGNFFIIGSLFSGTIDLLYDAPGDWKDIFIPLLNVNYCPDFYFIPILEIVIFVVISIKRYDKKKIIERNDNLMK